MTTFDYGFRSFHTCEHSRSVPDGAWSALTVLLLGGKDHRISPLDRVLSKASAHIASWWWGLPIPWRGRESASHKLARINTLGGGQRRSSPFRPRYQQGKLRPYFLRYSAEEIETMKQSALTKAQRTGDWAGYRLEMVNMPREGDCW